MPFEPIGTQEDFDRAIKERIERAAAKERERYADYDQIKEAAAASEATRAELDALRREKADREAADALREVAAEVAKEANVPASLLRGASREELEAHARAIAEAYGKPAAPVVEGVGAFSEAPAGEDDMRRFVRQLTGRKD